MGTRTTTRDTPPPSPLTARSIPLALPGVPPAVREATNRVHASARRHAEVAPQLRAALADARSAPGVDRKAATAAEAAGEPIPPETATAKLARAAELERELDAIDQAAKGCAREQDAAVREAAEDWSADVLGQVDAVVGQVDTALAALDEAFDQLDVLGALVVALDQVRGQGYPFAVSWPNQLGDGAARRQAARDKLTSSFVKATTARIRPDELTAALAILADEARGAAGNAEPAKPRTRRAAWSS